jgi:chaperonin GroEL
LRVGGASEVEVKEKKDRIDDALNATRAAVKEGVVAGGGCALLYASRVLEKLNPANQDQKVGIDIIRKAAQAPIRQIAENAGVDGAVVAGKLLESEDVNYGYNAQLGEYGDMIKAGIIDPTKVVRTALQDAASVGGLLITTEAMVTEAPQKECHCGGAAAPAGMPGGMGF